MRRNGIVRISTTSSNGRVRSNGTAHVHQYATSVIMQELKQPGWNKHSLVINPNESEPSITLTCTYGMDKGRQHIFTPSGDEVGWDEMLKFARAIQTIWGAGFNVR